jgi:hypothetical protein
MAWWLTYSRFTSTHLKLAGSSESYRYRRCRLPAGSRKRRPLEVREHEDVEQLGAGSGAECVESLTGESFDVGQVPRIGRYHSPARSDFEQVANRVSNRLPSSR